MQQSQNIYSKFSTAFNLQELNIAPNQHQNCTVTFSAHINVLLTISAWPGLLPMEIFYCSSGTENRGSAHSLRLCVFYVNRMAVYLYFSVIFRVEAELISFHSHREVEYDGWGCQTLLIEVNKRKAKELIQRLCSLHFISCHGKRLTPCEIILYHYFYFFLVSWGEILPQTNLGPNNTLVWL